MQRLEVSGAVRLIYRSLGVKGLMCLTDVLLYLEKLIPAEILFPHRTAKMGQFSFLQIGILCN